MLLVLYHSRLLSVDFQDFLHNSGNIERNLSNFVRVNIVYNIQPNFHAFQSTFMKFQRLVYYPVDHILTDSETPSEILQEISGTRVGTSISK